MDIYWKALCAAIVGIMLCLILSKNSKDYGTLIVILLCALLCSAAAGFIIPILSLLDKLSTISGTGVAWLEILLKTVGLSLIGETVTSICAESGHNAIGKSLQFLTTVVIIWICLPLVEYFLELIESILEML